MLRQINDSTDGSQDGGSSEEGCLPRDGDQHPTASFQQELIAASTNKKKQKNKDSAENDAFLQLQKDFSLTLPDVCQHDFSLIDDDAARRRDLELMEQLVARQRETKKLMEKVEKISDALSQQRRHGLKPKVVAVVVPCFRRRII